MKVGVAATLLAVALSLTTTAARRAPPPAVHVVRMELDGATPRFHPASLTIHPGDRVRFVNASGGPHNVSFDPAKLSPEARRVLAAAMSNQLQPFWGPLLLNAGDSYTISFAGMAPGRYEFFCMPHMSVGMRGSIVVE
jgi:plastocyanin